MANPNKYVNRGKITGHIDDSLKALNISYEANLLNNDGYNMIFDIVENLQGMLNEFGTMVNVRDMEDIADDISDEIDRIHAISVENGKGKATVDVKKHLRKIASYFYAMAK